MLTLEGLAFGMDDLGQVLLPPAMLTSARKALVLPLQALGHWLWPGLSLVESDPCWPGPGLVGPDLIGLALFVFGFAILGLVLAL